MGILDYGTTKFEEWKARQLAQPSCQCDLLTKVTHLETNMAELRSVFLWYHKLFCEKNAKKMLFAENGTSEQKSAQPYDFKQDFSLFE